MSMSVKLADSERSQAVLSANWMADIMLQKQLSLLERSEKNIVKQINTEKKSLQTKFQRKLFQSTMSQARLAGDKEMERYLKSTQSTGRVSIDRGIILGRRRSRIHSDPAYRPISALSGMSAIVNGVAAANTSPALHRRSKSMGDALENLAVFSRAFQTGTKVRPFTSSGQLTPKRKTEYFLPPIEPAKTGDPNAKKELVLLEETEPTFMKDGHPTETKSVKKESGNSCTLPILPQDGKLVVLPSQDNSLEQINTDEDLEECQTLVNKDVAHFYGVQNDIDKMTTFCKSVKPLSTGDKMAVDYYAMRALEQKMQKVVIIQPERPPTPGKDEERRKLLGDPTIPNLTFRPLNYDSACGSDDEDYNDETFTCDL